MLGGVRAGSRCARGHAQTCFEAAAKESTHASFLPLAECRLCCDWHTRGFLQLFEPVVTFVAADAGM